jgi:hypothetical protein
VIGKLFAIVHLEINNLELKCHDGLFVNCVNDGISIPVIHYFAIFNLACSLADRTAVRDQSALVKPAKMAFVLGFLAS